MDCEYTVTAAVPAGLAPGDGVPRSTGDQDDDVVVDDLGPDDTADPDGAEPEARDDGDAIVDLTVSVASVKPFLVQNVVGDAGGASASYELGTPCGAPGLPGAPEPRKDTGGITTTTGTTLVGLRTGRYNVSAALPDSNAVGKTVHGLADAGGACEATLTVSGVPASCSISHNSPASLAAAGGSVILEVEIDCSPPPAPEPPAEEPMDDGADDTDGDMSGDMGADDMSGDDMSGDMGADDMSGDDMSGDMHDGAGHMDGDMGPPQDTPTG